MRFVWNQRKELLVVFHAVQARLSDNACSCSVKGIIASLRLDYERRKIYIFFSERSDFGSYAEHCADNLAN
jgi:hypothetical protein